jgi:hypothetical protein
MPKKRRQLPEPPGGPFSRKKPFSEGAEAPGTADRLTAAMMEGRLEEFMEKEFGDVPHAKELAMRMLGATGMMPAAAETKPGKKKSGTKSAGTVKKGPGKSPKVSKEVMKAAEEGDTKTLGTLLADELRKRSGGGVPQKEGPKETLFDKADIDTLLEIAAQNNVSLDWVMARAIELYARDYRTTGRI